MCCSHCKHLKVIISQMSDYYCPKKEEYILCLGDVCDDFIFDNVTLDEKEEKIWG